MRNEHRRHGVRQVVAALALAAIATSIATAQDSYPNRVIKIVVPFAPGTTADQIPRLIGTKLAAKWGHQVIVENRPGATGNIGAEIVAKAPPDGYTLLSTAAPPLAINHSLDPDLKFDPTAFVPISLMTLVPNVLVVSAKLNAKSLQEFLALARSNPGGLTYVSTGSGGTPTLAMELLKLKSGTNIRDIPYRQGTGPAVMDVLGGRIDAMFINVSEAFPHIRSGGVTALGISTEKRIEQLPGIPAIAETFPGFYSSTWYALVAPPKTPNEIGKKLSAAVLEVLRMPDIADKLTSQSMIVIAASQTDTAAFIRSEVERWRDVIKAAGLKAN
ncbi:MAG: tripartite tricarboxylate transporter substrate binding protein [Betaproteobacteria bacterium]|nr:tripartite tricarboxylate transporter substrate binding protein [Betaproteobacteria bacterium]